MSQFDKLLERIKSHDKGLRFDELKKILEHYGYTMYAPKKGSSHRSFRKPGSMPITIPIHEPINIAYILLVKKLIESNETDEENS